METIKIISPRVSVASEHGRIYAIIERSSFFVEQTMCGTVEEATKLAQIAAWEMLAYDWQKKAHTAVLETEKDTCDSCPFRESTGCMSGDCPVFRLLECANKAPGVIKRTVKKLKAIKD